MRDRARVACVVAASVFAAFAGMPVSTAEAHDPACTFDKNGPQSRDITESGSDSMGYGLCSADTATVQLDYMGAGDDCERQLSRTHYANEEIYWWVVTESDPACKWNVQCKCSVIATVTVSTDVDDIWECDDADATSHVSISPGTAYVHAHAHSNSESDWDDDYDTLETPVQSRSCLPNNDDSLDFVVGAQSDGSIVSEAKAIAVATYDTFQFTLVSSSLCSHSH